MCKTSHVFPSTELPPFYPKQNPHYLLFDSGKPQNKAKNIICKSRNLSPQTQQTEHPLNPKLSDQMGDIKATDLDQFLKIISLT